MSTVNEFVLSGTIHTFSVPGLDPTDAKKKKEKVHTRRFGVGVAPFAVFIGATDVFRHDDKSGKGHQRGLELAHIKCIKRDMSFGDYTPSQFSVGLNPNHKKKDCLCIEEGLDGAPGTFRLTIKEGRQKLPLTDGQQRREALFCLYKDLQERLEKAKTLRAKVAEGETPPPTAEEEEILSKMAMLDRLPIPFMVNIDGEVVEDFLNLQKGKSVGKALTKVLEMTLQDDPELALAYHICGELNSRKDSPLYGCIQMGGQKAGALNIPWTSLCTKNTDIGTSLLGLARIGLSVVDVEEEDGDGALGSGAEPQVYKNPLSAGELAEVFCQVYQWAVENSPTVFEKDSQGGSKLLTKLSANGPKSGMNLFCGVATLVAFRMASDGRRVPDEDDLGALDQAFDYLDRSTEKEDGGRSFNANDRRGYISDAACMYFGDWKGPKHFPKKADEKSGDGIPLDLLSCMGWKAYNMSEDDV